MAMVFLPLHVVSKKNVLLLSLLLFLLHPDILSGNYLFGSLKLSDIVQMKQHACPSIKIDIIYVCVYIYIMYNKLKENTYLMC